MLRIEQVFQDVSRFSKLVSNINIAHYANNDIVVNIGFCEPKWEGYGNCYCIEKQNTCSAEDALAILFIFHLYDCQEWNKNEAVVVDLNKWGEYLRTIWIPEYFCSSGNLIPYKRISVNDFIEELSQWSWVKPLHEKFIGENILSVVEYAHIGSWSCHNFLIETMDSYYLCDYGTTA